MNEESFALELQNTFLTEAEEMLEETENAFVQIESNPTDSTKIDKIFRLVHTIKGSAHVAGFSELGDFAHTFETLLGALRDKQLSITSDIIDALLAGNDCLRNFVLTLKADKNSVIDVSSVALRLKGFLSDHEASNLPTDDASQIASEQQSEQPVGSHHTPELDRTETEVGETPVFLLCDDEPNILTLLEEHLSDAGFRVITTDSARKAIEIFNTQHIDVIFTDLKMPEMNGLEFAAQVRITNELVPIVFVSGHSSREHFKEYLKLGVDSFIDKPFSADEVISVAKRAVRLRRLHDALLALSRLSFKAYVSIEKILATNSVSESSANEKAYLDSCMQEIKRTTNKLLASERHL